MKLGNPKNTIEVIQKYDFDFQKKFGQNFLIDERVLEKIISAAEVNKDDFVLEIGPGIGTMTQYLAENAREVMAVEIDKNLIPILSDTLSAYDNVSILNADILKVDIAKIVEEKNGGKPVKVAKSPSATGRPSSGFLITRPTPLAAMSSKNRPIPIPVPCATPCGKLRKIQLRIPVAEITVNSTPIRNTAPSATGTLICCPSTRLNAVNAVREMAQPIANGRLAHRPITIEPSPATRQVATKTAAGGKPALPNIPGTTMTE